MADSNDGATSQALGILLAHLRTKRSQLDEAINALEKLGDIHDLEHGKTLGEPLQDAPTEVIPGMFTGLTIADAVKQLLLIKNRPLKNAEIIEGLVEGGHAFTAAPAGAAAALSTALHRRAQTTKDIVKLGRGVWSLSKDRSRNRPRSG